MIPSQSELDTLKQRYHAASQSHVFQFWDTLTSEQQTQLYTQLLTIDPERVNAVYDAATKQAQFELDQGGQLQVRPPPKERVGSTVQRNLDGATAAAVDDVETVAKEWESKGLDAIKEGKVAVLLMAGGQGTRLGSSAPKGCYDIGLDSHKSLFQLQAERIRRLQTIAAAGAAGQDPHRARVPWYIMTSGPTRKPTEAFFAEQNFFGLDKADVVFFEQGRSCS